MNSCFLPYSKSTPHYEKQRNQWRNIRVRVLLLTGKFLLTYWEKRDKEKKGKWSRREGKSKTGKWKIENGRRESYKTRRGFFFFFGLSLFKTTKICFGSTKMQIFYWEKASGVIGRGMGGRVPPRDFWPGNFCWRIGKKEARKKVKRCENWE